MSLKSDRKEREFDRGIDRFAVQHGKRIVERALDKKKGDIGLRIGSPEYKAQMKRANKMTHKMIKNSPPKSNGWLG